MPRVRRKTEVATIKLTPEVRRAWEAAAETERRSLANVFEVAILEYAKRRHIAVPSEQVVAILAKQNSPGKTADADHPATRPTH